ncbi:MAG: VOC family protein [Halioglobus sp.]
MQSSLTPFHLAIEVRDLGESRSFYGNLLGCAEGRSDSCWVDFNFFGHQLVCHQSETYPGKDRDSSSNPVDGHDVPVPHFGVVLEMEPWQSLADKLQDSEIKFVIEPYTRFEGQPGEQATMFFLDPSGNPLEFKAFKNINEQLFAR